MMISDAVLHLERASEPASLELADDDAECCVVSAMLQDTNAVAKARRNCQATDFASPTLRGLFLGIVGATTKRGTSDPLIVADEMRTVPSLNGRSWKELIGLCLDVVPNSAHVEQHARIVSENARRRHAVARMREIERATTRGISPAEIAEQLDSLAATMRTGIDNEGPVVRTLTELYADPAMLCAPECVVPLLAWRGRTTLFAAREKLGKTTYLAYAVACCSAGRRFLGHEIRPLRVMWVGLEEHPNDMVRRFRDMNAASDNVWLVLGRLNGVSDLAPRVRESRPDVVFIDSLTEFTPGMASRSSPDEWQPVMSELNRIARVVDTAVVILHHANRAAGEYRDSSVIGAAVDMILTMKPGSSPTHREISAKGRWYVGDHVIRYASGVFSLVGDDLQSLDVLVTDFIRDHPGASKRSVREGVGGNAAAVDAMLRSLCQRRLLVNDISRRANSYKLPASNAGDEVGHGTDTPSRHSRGGPTNSLSDNARHGGDTVSGPSVSPLSKRETGDTRPDSTCR